MQVTGTRKTRVARGLPGLSPGLEILAKCGTRRSLISRVKRQPTEREKVMSSSHTVVWCPTWVCYPVTNEIPRQDSNLSHWNAWARTLATRESDEKQRTYCNCGKLQKPWPFLDLVTVLHMLTFFLESFILFHHLFLHSYIIIVPSVNITMSSPPSDEFRWLLLSLERALGVAEEPGVLYTPAIKIHSCSRSQPI